MPRYPFRAELAAQCRQEAGLTDDYITELSYQTDIKYMFIIMTKGTKTLEHAARPDLTRLVRQVAELLKIGKSRLFENGKLEDYLDTSIVLPDKPAPVAPTTPDTGPSRPGQPT